MLGDLAEKVVSEMGDEFVAPIDEQLPQDVLAQERIGIFTKIRFAWGAQDKAILDRVSAAANSVFFELYGDVIAVIDDFYASMRVPDVTEHGTTRIDSSGRIVWKLDEHDHPVEDISQLTGQDIETAILRLQRLMLEIAPRIDELMREAVYAHHVSRDTHDDAWFSSIEGTQGDRTARSNQASRIDRYHAYFRYCLYSAADSFHKEVQQFIRRLENVRYRQTRSQ